jgi:hypothetical protein
VEISATLRDDRRKPSDFASSKQTFNSLQSLDDEQFKSERERERENERLRLKGRSKNVFFSYSQFSLSTLCCRLSLRE